MPDIYAIVRGIRRYSIAALGGLLILIGTVTGPMLLIPVGVAVLAWEFPSVRRVFRRALVRLRRWWRGRKRQSARRHL